MIKVKNLTHSPLTINGITLLHNEVRPVNANVHSKDILFLLNTNSIRIINDAPASSTDEAKADKVKASNKSANKSKTDTINNIDNISTDSEEN